MPREGVSNIVAKHRFPSRTLYLDGTFKFSSGAAFPVINPATEDVIGDVADTTPRGRLLRDPVRQVRTEKAMGRVGRGARRHHARDPHLAS